MHKKKNNVYSEKEEAVERIVSSLFSKKKGKTNSCEIIIMTGCGPKCGTSTSVQAIAEGLKKIGGHVLVMDCDFRKAKQKINNSFSSNGWVECTENNTIREAIVFGKKCESDFLPMGTLKGSVIPILEHPNFQNFMEEIRKEYDFVLIDVPPITIMEESLLLTPFIDGIIMVAGINRVMKQQIAKAKDILEKYNETYYGMLVTDIDQNEYHRTLKDYQYYERRNSFLFHLFPIIF